MLTLHEGDRKSFPAYSIVDYWGQDERGTSCVYVRVMEYENYTVLCDIQVRAGWRGNGLASRIISELEDLLGNTMFSLGKFTPSGYETIGHKLPVISHQEPEIAYQPMNFVRNWDNFDPYYPL